MTGQKLHIPVLLSDISQAVENIPIDKGIFVDGTFGRGGHISALQILRPQWCFLGIDCDQEAVAYAQVQYKDLMTDKKLDVVKGNFSDFSSIIKNHPWFNAQEKGPLGVLLDLGVSSPQLDQAARGFSFYHDGPLDMRMDQSLDFSAADIVNTWSEKELNDLFFQYGEVHRPFRVSQRIIEVRREQKFTQTLQLSELIAKTEGWRQKGYHPATNYFMALRIEVNQELTRLKNAIPEIAKSLQDKGLFLVITFHSLEDRIVKTAFKELVNMGVGDLVNKKVIQATWEEKKQNPRARSAKLRIFQRKVT